MHTTVQPAPDSSADPEPMDQEPSADSSATDPAQVGGAQQSSGDALGSENDRLAPSLSDVRSLYSILPLSA